jgi:hypothetical protein
MSVRTAECHGPQSCFPVSKGISFVVGKEIFEKGLYVLEWWEFGEVAVVRKVGIGGLWEGEIIGRAGSGTGCGAKMGADCVCWVGEKADRRKCCGELA